MPEPCTRLLIGGSDSSAHNVDRCDDLASMTQRLVMAKALVCCLACCMMCDVAMQGILEHVCVPRILEVILGYHVPFCFMQEPPCQGMILVLPLQRRHVFKRCSCLIELWNSLSLRLSRCGEQR